MPEYQKWLYFQHILVLFIISMKFGGFKNTNNDVLYANPWKSYFWGIQGQ